MWSPSQTGRTLTNRLAYLRGCHLFLQLPRLRLLANGAEEGFQVAGDIDPGGESRTFDTFKQFGQRRHGTLLSVQYSTGEPSSCGTSAESCSYSPSAPH